MPRPKTNPNRTDAQRATRNASNYRLTTVIGCKLDRETAERYRAFCDSNGTTPNAEIKAFILSRLAEAAEQAAQEAGEIGEPKTE